MNRPLILLTSLLLSITCFAQNKILLHREGDPNTLKLYEGNKRYLEYNGKPLILITSAEHYGALVNLDFDYKLYLQTLGSEGFNYTRIFTGSYIEPVNNIFGIEKNTLAPQPGRYIAPWLKTGGKYDLDKFNPEFFNRLKNLVSKAEEQGIIVEITLFTSIYADNAWSLSPFNIENNLNGAGDLDFHMVNTLFNGELRLFQEKYIRKMVSELNGFNNIFFEIQNEPWADNGNVTEYLNLAEDDVYSQPWQKKVEIANGVALDWQAWVVSVIRDEESKWTNEHLIAQNISNFQHEMEAFPEGVSMINYHYAHPGAVIQNLDLNGVIGLDETGFMPHEDHLYINQAWRFILSGGGLYNNLDYSFTAGNEAGSWSIPDSNPGWGGPEFRKKLSLLVSTLKQVPFYEMEFYGEILLSEDFSLKQYGLQKPGEFYLVFLENYLGAQLVPDVKPGKYKITWLNVDTGEKKISEEKISKGSITSVPFEENQVVLIMERID